MGEKRDESKDTTGSHKNGEVFHTSAVDRLAKFVDAHRTEIRVSLFYWNLLGLHFLYNGPGIIAHP